MSAKNTTENVGNVGERDWKTLYITNPRERIIPSLTYCDFYKLTMLQFFFHKFATVEATYDLKVRSDFDFAPHIDEINYQIDLLCELRFTEEELEKMSAIRFFKPTFIEFLRGFSMNRKYIHAYVDVDGKFKCYSKGPLTQASMDEIYILTILQEIRSREVLTNENFVTGEEILSTNISQINEFSKYKPFKVSDFSCRRAASVRWLDHVISRLNKEVSNRNFTGTSCVYYAFKYNITAIGTMAHEAMMLGQAMVHPYDSQEFILNKWNEEYEGDLGIALSDTFGADYFIKKVFNKGLALQFTGVRHDSGDPFKFGDDIIDMYRRYGINAMNKTIVFSDGLTVEKAFKLCEYFNGQIDTSFGIGTNLGNAMGIPALQIVMKMVEANGKSVAKVSDTLGKGMCRDMVYEQFVKNHIDRVNAQ
jgi:nicotinate phosphoribosyltransferase